jgi:predicted ferric reductase
VKHPHYTLAQSLWYGIAAAGALAVVLFWWLISGDKTALDAASLEIALGNITGLIGTYSVLWQLLLLSRLPLIENAFGLETITKLHRWNGYIAFYSLLAHAVFLTLGFALVDRTGIIAQFLDFQTHWEDVLKATIGFILLIAVVGLSIAIVRRRLKYETWYFVHLTVYLMILLAFGHQLSVGTDFVGHAAFRLFWYVLYAAAIGLLIWYRILAIGYRLYRHRFTVARIVHETPRTISIYVTGRHLEQFHFVPGQFVIWRFLCRGLWWQAHPFSLSKAPNGGKHLRLTVKMLGDFTRQLEHLKPGTLVSLDGPHGHFTLATLSRPNVLFIAGGSGITPIRAMLEALPPEVKHVTLLYAVPTQADLALRRELEALMARYDGKLHYILHGIIDAASLAALVPDAATCEVWLCGPPTMMKAVTAALQQVGVRHHLIHTERFAY